MEEWGPEEELQVCPGLACSDDDRTGEGQRVCCRSRQGLNGSVGACVGRAPVVADTSICADTDGVRAVVPVPFAAEEDFPGTRVRAFSLTADAASFEGGLALQNRHN